MSRISFGDGWKWYQKLVLNIISQGPIPKHVAIIADGNRRYGKQKQLANVTDGHRKGADKILKLLRLLTDAGVEELTVYVFSIENFKRPKEEVAGLIALGLEQIKMILDNIEEFHEAGIRFEVFGDWARIPQEARVQLARLTMLTKDNSKLKLNAAIVYTGRDEIVRGANRVLSEVYEGDYSVDDISEHVLQRALSVHDSKPVDMLIRTSGECRLSDFLLWQTDENTFLQFVDVAWPAFKPWHFLTAILAYQRHVLYSKTKKPLQVLGEHLQDAGQVKLIQSIREKQWDRINDIINADGVLNIM